MLKRLLKFLFSQKKPCIECQHLKYGVTSNAPICFLNDAVYMQSKNIERFTCEYWNKNLEGMGNKA